MGSRMARRGVRACANYCTESIVSCSSRASSRCSLYQYQAGAGAPCADLLGGAHATDSCTDTTRPDVVVKVAHRDHSAWTMHLAAVSLPLLASPLAGFFERCGICGAMYRRDVASTLKLLGHVYAAACTDSQGPARRIVPNMVCMYA